MTDPEIITCPYCLITSDDGLQHLLSCPALQYEDDIDEPEYSDGVTPPADDGTPIPYDGASEDLFQGDDRHGV